MTHESIGPPESGIRRAHFVRWVLIICALGVSQAMVRQTKLQEKLHFEGGSGILDPRCCNSNYYKLSVVIGVGG